MAKSAESVLKRIAEKRGLTVVHRGNGHFQIIGGALLVNYYPESNKRAAYIQGMACAHYRVSPEQAVEMAVTPQGLPIKTKRRGKYHNRKMLMYRKSNVCYRCQQPILTADDATIDHRVPLSQGGLDHHNNMVLAHTKCNHEAGNKMPRSEGATMTDQAKPSDVLQSIADVLLGCPEVWTQDADAENVFGNAVQYSSPHATKWCALGLMKACAGYRGEDICRRYFISAILPASISSWNDMPGRTAAEVQAAFQKAADLARSEGK